MINELDRSRTPTTPTTPTTLSRVTMNVRRYRRRMLFFSYPVNRSKTATSHSMIASSSPLIRYDSMRFASLSNWVSLCLFVSVGHKRYEFVIGYKSGPMQMSSKQSKKQMQLGRMELQSVRPKSFKVIQFQAISLHQSTLNHSNMSNWQELHYMNQLEINQINQTLITLT